MGKAAAFVCVAVLGIILVTSADTDSNSSTESTLIEESVSQNRTRSSGNKSKSKSTKESTLIDENILENRRGPSGNKSKSNSTTESTLIEENVFQNETVPSGNKLDNDNSEETNEREVSSQNSQQKGNVGEGDETESSSSSKSEVTTTRRPGNNGGRRKGPGGKKANNKGPRSNQTLTTDKPAGRSAPIQEITTTLGDTDEDPKPNTPVCASPPDIEGAMTPQLQGTEHPVGTTVSYNCPFGYVSRNSINHVSVCTLDSETGTTHWTTPVVTCIPRSCGDPGYVSKGRRVGNLFTFPNKVEYVCEEGYKLRGLSSRYCQAGGDWSGVLPTCDQIYCKVPADPPNGRVRYSSLEYGTELRYECNAGFLLKKHQPRICSDDGNWSNDEPECIEASCEEPQPPEFGTVKLHGALKVGSLATYSCDPGRKLYGATTTKCLISGQWTFDAPQCLRSCKVPFIENGEVGTYETRYSRRTFTKVLARENVESQQTLTLRCKNGYFPVGNSNVMLSSNSVDVTCRDGAWSRDLQCKRRSCTVPFIQNGEVGTYATRSSLMTGTTYAVFTKVRTGQNVDPQQTLTLRCEKGYTPVGNSDVILSSNSVDVTCSDGAWSRDLQCKRSASCQGQPPPSKSARPIIGSREHGHTIWYECTAKYTKKIPGNVTCHFGSWIGITPRCLNKPCYTRDLNYPGLAKPPEEDFDSSESFEINCERGYRKRTRNQTISCAEGRWQISQNPCIFEGEESRIISPTQELQLSYGGENQPGTNVESSSPRTTEATPNPECFCYYEYKDFHVKIQTKHRILAERDAVKLGETVSLECVSPNHRLKWENGLRFFGKASMTCSTCKEWLSKDLPTCTRPTGDTVITYDGDFKIMPGGIINMQRRESRQYECKSAYGIPVWDYGQRWNVHTRIYQSFENGRKYYIMNMDIRNVSDQNNGEYECFLRDDQGYRIGSTYFNVQVHDEEDRSTTTAQPGVLTGGKVTHPSVKVETSTNRTSDAKSNEDCFCTYEYEDPSVKAQLGQKVLKVGDTIRRGERVSFECIYDHRTLTWENGLRLSGKANMTCSTCNKWQKRDVPSCTFPDWREVVISINDNLDVLPGGIAIVKKGEINTFPCTSSWKYPEWNYGQRRGVSVTTHQISVSGTPYYVSVLIIDKDENDPSGEYECYMNDIHGQRIGSAFLNLQAYDYLSCPEFTLTPGLNITYSKDLSVGSVASFECSQPTKDLDGSSSSVCLENGRWSNPLPSCEEQKCSMHDLGVSVPEEVEPDMSKVTEEYVLLGFEIHLKCAKGYVITGNSKALCEKQGKWKLGSFQCVPGCVINRDPSSHLLVEPEKEGYRIGERIKLSCPPGEKLSSDVEQLMCLTNSWSDSLPNCIEGEKKSGN